MPPPSYPRPNSTSFNTPAAPRTSTVTRTSTTNPAINLPPSYRHSTSFPGITTASANNSNVNTATPAPGGGASNLSGPSSSSTLSAASLNRTRQYTHLHAQLATLNANMADLENLVSMTAVQAECVRGLGGWWGGAYMAASKVLGEETADGGASRGGAEIGERNT